MVFSSVVFLCLFLPFLLIAYYLVPPRFRNLVALIGSLIFYAWGAPKFVFVLVLTSYFDYLASRLMNRSRDGRNRSLLLGCSIAVNLGVFLYCKYMNFFVEQVNGVLQWSQHDGIAWTTIVMPIGISFFTFQKLSYLVDVYRRTVEPAAGFGHYLLYVSLFPQLIAGPIVRYHDVSRQLVKRTYTDEQFLAGAWRFSIGLAKKVLIANTLAVAVDAAFGSTSSGVVDPARLTCGAAWIAAVCYAMQLYFDFSGYSDMAIGLGRMLGFDFLENFNYPYVSRSFTEFWRRWHISLSNWMREYLYIPLGGNRGPSWRVYLNLWIVFLLSGFWHGASWNFLVWGAVHGSMLTAERLAGRRNWIRWPALLAVPRTFVLVLIAWIFFRAWDLPQAVGYLAVMFAPLADSAGRAVDLAAIMTPQVAAVLVIAVVLSLAPLLGKGHRLLQEWTVSDEQRFAHIQLASRAAVCVLLLMGSFAIIVTSDFNPFIYFRF